MTGLSLGLNFTATSISSHKLTEMRIRETRSCSFRCDILEEMATLDVADVSTEIWRISDSPQHPVCCETNEREETFVHEVVAHRVENASSVNWLRAVASVVKVGFRRDKCGTCIAVQFWGADL